MRAILTPNALLLQLQIKIEEQMKRLKDYSFSGSIMG